MANTRRNNTIVLVTIAVIAAALALSSFQYSNLIANEVSGIAGKEAQSNSAIESFELSHILETKVGIVAFNIEQIVDSSAVHNQQVTESKDLFANAQKMTSDFTVTYFWVDQNGKLIWSDSFTNQTLAKQYSGGDRSTRDYFIQPKETHKPYYSTLVESVDGIPRLYVSYPIIDEQGSFKGIVAAAVSLNVLGKYLESQLSPQFKSTVGMLDRNGLILYTQKSTLIGKSIFGGEVQNLLPATIKDSFNAFVRDSLRGVSGSGDISYGGNSTTIAYEPVTINGNFFAVLYITTPHVFASDLTQLIDQQRNFNLIVVIIIGIVTVGIGFLVMTWNRRLTASVEKKTAELKTANESLVQSNSQLEKANEQLLVHDKMQKEFINVAAHELRTPTQAIIGYVDLLEMEPSSDEKSREEQIRAISRNASRLERLTSDILDVTRIEGRSLNLQKELVNLDYIIASSIRDLKSHIINGNVKFVYEPTNIAVNVDKTRLAQVISNLLSNAIKFTPKGQIMVTAEKKFNEVIITVKDTGDGIDPEVLPRLFTKFTTKSQTGTGLGLFISKAIVEAHGGRIWAENNKDGKGATFAFTLPA